jgi:hypothetical protein
VLPGFHLLPVSRIVRVNRPLQDGPWNFGPLSAVCVVRDSQWSCGPGASVTGSQQQRKRLGTEPPMSCVGGTHKDRQVCKRRAGSGPRRALTFTRRQAGRPTSRAANGIRVVHQHEDGQDGGLTIPQSVLLRADRREGCAQALTERGPMKECRHTTVVHPVQSFAWPLISDPVAGYMWVV